MSPSARRDPALRQLLHDLRSGVVGVGAVAAAMRARLDGSADERTRRELELLVRTADALDRTIGHARALLHAPRATTVELAGAATAALARAATTLAARALVAPAVPPLPTVRADAALLDAALDQLVTAVAAGAAPGARLRIEAVARAGTLRLALVADVAGPAAASAAAELLRATAARMHVKVGWSRSSERGIMGQLILRRGP